MLDCLIIGDSIAVGTQQQVPICEIHAKVGINSKDFNKKYKIDFIANIVVISLGSNDYQGIKTIKELIDIRNRVKAEKVYWILPANNEDVKYIVENVAEMYQDWTIRIPNLSKDRVHPTTQGYKRIGEIIDEQIF